MVCLGRLVTIAVLAFITPVLPLQPPDRINTALQYSSPSLSPLWEHTFKLDLQSIQDTDAMHELLNTEKTNVSTSRPFRDAGFPELNSLSQSMVKIRQKIF